jgi:hypothetical protein
VALRGRQRRWVLWVVGLWSSFLSRSLGVPRAQVPPEWRAVAREPPLGAVCRSPEDAHRRPPGACVGPRSGKFSGGNKDGLGGAAGTPAVPRPGTGCFASLP